MKKIIFLLFTTITFAQSSIVASGESNYTVGETLPIMQQCDTIVSEVTLSNPSFEYPTEPKPIPKKKISFWEKLIQAIKKLFKK